MNAFAHDTRVKLSAEISRDGEGCCPKPKVSWALAQKPATKRSVRVDQAIELRAARSTAVQRAQRKKAGERLTGWAPGPDQMFECLRAIEFFIGDRGVVIWRLLIEDEPDLAAARVAGRGWPINWMNMPPRRELNADCRPCAPR